MEQKDILKIYNKFNRVQNQYSVVQRSFVFNKDNNTIYPSEMQVLTTLKNNPDYSVSDISESLYISKSAASQLAKKLSIKGYLNKTRDRVNERFVLLEITKAGLELIDDFIKSRTTSFGEMVDEFKSLSESEVSTIYKFLDTLESMFDKKLKKVKT